MYVHCDAVNCAAESARQVACVEELDGWMASNRLKLNAAKVVVDGRFESVDDSVYGIGRVVCR